MKLIPIATKLHLCSILASPAMHCGFVNGRMHRNPCLGHGRWPRWCLTIHTPQHFRVAVVPLLSFLLFAHPSSVHGRGTNH